VVAGGTVMGLLWYVAAILIWWVVAGCVGGYSGLLDFVMMMGFTAFFYIPWWFTYVTCLAVGEAILFEIAPRRRLLFVIFAGLSFVVLWTIESSYPNWHSVGDLLVYPAVAVTILYLVRHFTRPPESIEPLG